MTKYIRASLLKFHSPEVSGEWVRQLVVAGKYGPRFRQRGRERATLLLLDTVLATLADPQDLAPAIERYQDGHKCSRPPILELDPSQVVKVQP